MVDRQGSKVGRPQTLKQAKRAYNKAGARPKVDAREFALAERRIQLQQRAEQIRDKEARKKANAKKRVEKREREKAALIRQGKEVPKEGGFKIGPSQLELTKFLPITNDPEQEHDEAPSKQRVVNRMGQKTTGHAQFSNQSVSHGRTEEPGYTTSDSRAATALDNRPIGDEEEKPASKSGEVPHRASKSRPIIEDQFEELFPSNTQIEREISQLTPRNAIHINQDHHHITVNRLSDSLITSDSASLSDPDIGRRRATTWISNPSYRPSENFQPRPRPKTTAKVDSGYATKQQTPRFGPSTSPDPTLPTIENFDLSSAELEAIAHQFTQPRDSFVTKTSSKTQQPAASSSFDYDGFADDELSELNAMADQVDVATSGACPPQP